MTKVAIAGSTGYLGKFLVQVFLQHKLEVIALARNLDKLDKFNDEHLQKIQVDFTNPQSMAGTLKEADYLISTVGITRQKDGLSYMDVDYQANSNLLAEAQKAGVKKFIYVSVLNGTNLRNLKICEAKERFVDELKISGINYTVIRPSGFFSDMTDILNMAQKGRVYLFGNGECKLNPIHGKDLANLCFETLHSNTPEIEVGGPEIFTQNELATLAFKTWGRNTKISYLPNWLRKSIIGISRTFFSSKTYGPVAFFLTAMASDMIAPKYGKERLEDFYSTIVSKKITMS
ncbi:SDR family oxidoreductase [uncultured Draconibacterium sp.]|uniref:SDR family oxidoreductase n=1 Tax=uncultured Draconibacterium sp. TaxID=1573823 RepID=UPI0032165970